jgi:uncharacterized membrane protein YdbT with pleckstrin-like domain
MNSPSVVVICKVWRSELRLILTFLITSVLSVAGSAYLPITVLPGTLISVDAWRLEIALPLLWLAPLFFIFLAMFRIYNVRYELTSRGIDAYEWVLGPQTVMSIRYEDIRSLETEQSIIGRMLDVGNLQIGTAAQSSVEVTFRGISSPGEVLKIIQRERDRRHQLENQPYPSQGRAEL